jgi:small ligand-binding sensory domain FIST
VRFSSAISTARELDTACAEAAAAAGRGLGGDADLCIVFASAAWADVESAPARIAERTGARCLIGCTGGGIIGGEAEIEGRPAVSVMLAQMPGVRLDAVHLTESMLPSDDAPPSRWSAIAGAAADPAGFVVLPEPFHFPAARLLAGFDYAFAAAPKIGGIASAPPRSAGPRLFLGRDSHAQGAVVLGVSGAIHVEARVAQGCKPFGRIGRITRADGCHLRQIDGRTAIGFLQDQLQQLEGEDLELARSTPLFLGVAMDPFRTEQPRLGDFLVRNVLDYQHASGSIAVGDVVSPGRLVQFHLRDGRSSAQDLRATLAGVREPLPRGALLFSCLGRGAHLYGAPDHDSRVFRESVGRVPLGGFFCNGEIGPVRSTTYLHGYTSVFALFRERAPAAQERA